VAFVEITDPEQACKLREVGLLWYDDNWISSTVDSPTALRPGPIELEQQKLFMADGYKYYVLLED